jgi:hypothetical protein
MKTKYIFCTFMILASFMLLISLMHHHFIIPATWQVVRYGNNSVFRQHSSCSPGVCEIVFKLIETSDHVSFDINTCVRTHYVITQNLLTEFPLHSKYSAYVGKNYCEIHSTKDYTAITNYLSFFGVIFIILACAACTLSYILIKNRNSITSEHGLSAIELEELTLFTRSLSNNNRKYNQVPTTDYLSQTGHNISSESRYNVIIDISDPIFDSIGSSP